MSHPGPAGPFVYRRNGPDREDGRMWAVTGIGDPNRTVLQGLTHDEAEDIAAALRAAPSSYQATQAQAARVLTDIDRTLEANERSVELPLKVSIAHGWDTPAIEGGGIGRDGDGWKLEIWFRTEAEARAFLLGLPPPKA